MTRILLINPNSSTETTDMMVAIAQAVAADGVTVVGATAHRSPAMIVEPHALTAAEGEVVEIGIARAAAVSGIMVAAFGDPGCNQLRARVDIPVVGIAEASMLEAASPNRRFGVATVTPRLAEAIAARAVGLGLGDLYTGIRLTQGDPQRLAADSERLIEALSEAIARCIGDDGAEAVIIGGGPLGRAATVLAARFNTPIIAPIPAALRRLVGLIQSQTTQPHLGLAGQPDRSA